MGIPCKTAAGHAELVGHECQLSHRHRTLLLLVDGTRPLEDVIRLGREAGVPRGYIDELFALGLIVIGPPMAPVATEDMMPTYAPTTTGGVPWADTVGMGGPMSNTDLARLDAQDLSFAEARSAMLKVLREHAPVTGAVMMLRIRRARSRAELRTLLPDVQARLIRSQRQAEARQLLLRVESLLAMF